MPNPTRVLIVDDSALVRQVLQTILNAEPDIEVVGLAEDPLVARDKIKQLNPDVLTLDVEMPRMDGIKFLSNLMRLRPMPVVMVSSLTQQGAEATLAALELGAVDFVAKPEVDVRDGLDRFGPEIVAKVRAAAKSRPRQRSTKTARPAPTPARSLGVEQTTDKVMLIGASTGGTEAIKEVLMGLPPDCPGTLIVQHIPVAFVGPYAERINALTTVDVRVAEHGETIRRGCVRIAPGDRHLELRRDGAHYVCHLIKGAPVSGHCPSVDVLFRSAAAAAGSNATAALLTGMGRDGAEGLLELHKAGSFTIAQDENTSVVWGMPRCAIELGAADFVAPLGKVSSALLQPKSLRARV